MAATELKKICKRCYVASKATGTLEAVKQLLKSGHYICPQLDSKCGNTADFKSNKTEPDSFAKVVDVFFNGRPA